VIKAAFPGDFRDPRLRCLFEASTTACRETGAALTIHTEQGAGVERLVEYLDSRSVKAHRVVLCHLDKRPDAALHRRLAREGFLLEYDTFASPKYRPDERVWPLFEQMITDDYSGSIACGLDLADSSQWAFSSSGEGMCELTKRIVARLRSIGASSSVVHALTAHNIWSRLAVPTNEASCQARGASQEEAT
jgi:phosphotriesterase-related protein